MIPYRWGTSEISRFASEKWVKQKSTTLYRSQAPEVSAPLGELAPGIVRPLAIFGAIAPLLFASIVVVAGSLRPTYSHISQFISELGYGPNAIVQNVNFVFRGMLVAAFSYGLHTGLPAGSRKGPAFTTAFGIGLIGAGVFPGDPASPSVQSVHFLFATVVEISGVLAPLFVYGRLKKKNAGARRLSRLSLCVALVGLLQLLTFYGGVFSSTVLEPWRGVVQRAFFTIPFLWIEATAVGPMGLSSGGENTYSSLAPNGRVTIILALATLSSWLGEVVHNAIELPRLTILSPENSVPGIVVALIFGAYLFLPFKRTSLRLLLGLGALNLVGGGIISVLPLSFLPYVPAQTATHYLVHVFYSVAEIPLILTTTRMLRMP